MSSIREDILGMVHEYQTIDVLMAACELDLFTFILSRGKSPTVQELAMELELDNRALDALLSALIASGFLNKVEGRFHVVPDYEKILDSRSPDTVVPMIRHQACVMRSWSQLAWTVKSGIPVPHTASINGSLVDYQSFIGAMNVIGRSMAQKVAAKMEEGGLLHFDRLLDLGGASGTYTLAFLERNPTARAIIFDLSIAIEEARHRLIGAPCSARIDLVEGDFYRDKFPDDIDFIWISAIIHQQDLNATKTMFQKSWQALRAGGRIAIRDIFFNSERTGPKKAALFNINMLVNTQKGRTYISQEVFQLLMETGFRNPRLAISSDDMSSVIVAEKEG